MSTPEVAHLVLNFAVMTANPSLVGFTGSGQQMRKDPGRSRHIYQHGTEEEGG